ncbi:MAG: hypothetical protein H7256_10755, partial [Bdellovibrio sp.]|nr:hypothetical protein [Bdellovibrio sp.]
MHASQIILKAAATVLLYSSFASAAGLESTTGVTTHSGALLDANPTAGAVKQTNPADGAITTPTNDATTGMTDQMQQSDMSKKSRGTRAKQVCA